MKKGIYFLFLLALFLSACGKSSNSGSGQISGTLEILKKNQPDEQTRLNAKVDEKLAAIGRATSAGEHRAQEAAENSLADLLKPSIRMNGWVCVYSAVASSSSISCNNNGSYDIDLNKIDKVKMGQLYGGEVIKFSGEGHGRVSQSHGFDFSVGAESIEVISKGK